MAAAETRELNTLGPTKELVNVDRSARTTAFMHKTTRGYPVYPTNNIGVSYTSAVAGKIRAVMGARIDITEDLLSVYDLVKNGHRVVFD